VISVLLTVYPLKQDIKQKVTPKNAKRKEHLDRHIGLIQSDANAHTAKQNIEAETLESAEMFMKNSLTHSSFWDLQVSVND
jgi:hypothetical protein